jgi:mannose-1-phosphate guanylyltransferase
MASSYYGARRAAKLAIIPGVLPAMVLAAGLGTRLRPLTEHRAKALVPVGDRPALAHVLDRLRGAGVSRVVVNAHHHVEQLRAFALGQAGVDLGLSEETDLLGTAGGIAHASALLGAGDVLLWNADILADVNVRGLLAAHRDEATLVVQPLARGQGSVGLDEEGRVVRLRKESFADEARGGQFLGIHVLGEALRARLPLQGGLIEDVYLPALGRGEVLRAHFFEGPWHDIGTTESYLEANVAWLVARGLDHWIGPGARVADGVVLEGTVVGEGASVTGRGALTRCVVWPGASAAAPVEGRVIA